jgi:hypothetical protein
MQRNVGGIDRALRIVAGAALLAWASFGDGAYHLWGLVGILPLATGIFGWCPAYVPFGWKTCAPR